MKIKSIFEICGNGLMYVFTVVQTKEIFQIISLCLSILISLIIIVSKVVEWFKKAKEDGKITKEELNELTNNVKEDVNDIKDNVEEIIEIIEEQEKEN